MYRMLCVREGLSSVRSAHECLCGAASHPPADPILWVAGPGTRLRIILKAGDSDESRKPYTVGPHNYVRTRRRSASSLPKESGRDASYIVNRGPCAIWNSDDTGPDPAGRKLRAPVRRAYVNTPPRPQPSVKVAAAIQLTKC